MFVEIAPRGEGGPHGPEVARPAAVKQAIDALSGRALRIDVLIPSAPADRGHADFGGGNGSGLLFEPLQHFPPYWRDPFLGIMRGAKIDADRDDSFRAETGVDVQQLLKTSDEQHRTGG